MEIIDSPFNGVYLLKPRVFGDERGYFFESFNQIAFNKLIGRNDIQFVQDNQSLSQIGVLRGLHFQVPPYAQGKLVRVIQGSVKDVVVDLRKSSSTYGKHFSVVLSGENHLQLYIPKGFAHGFLTLEDRTIFTYKCTDYYNKEAEDHLFWKDPTLNIEWGVDDPIVSEKDQIGKYFSQFQTPFN